MQGPPTKAYNPRHPERTLLYRTIAEHIETWLELASAGQFDGQGDHHTPAPHVEKAFRKYLEYGIFGSSLNTHVHFHVCVVDGVFEALPDANSDAQSPESAGSVNAPSITFHAEQIDDAAIAQMQTQVQANVRKRLLRAFVARGHMEAHDAKDINERAASSSHGGGFSVDTGAGIEAPDRAGLERLLRYCARPPFACGSPQAARR